MENFSINTYVCVFVNDCKIGKTIYKVVIISTREGHFVVYVTIFRELPLFREPNFIFGEEAIKETFVSEPHNEGFSNMIFVKLPVSLADVCFYFSIYYFDHFCPKRKSACLATDTPLKNLASYKTGVFYPTPEGK